MRGFVFKMNKLLIGALSCQAYPERRERCLRSWAADLDRFENVDLLFLIGGCEGPPRAAGRELYLPCPDDYASLPRKILQFLRWALVHREFDYLFKCDDDTYLRLDRLLSYDTKQQDYIGAEWAPGVNYASGGAGYFLSRKAADIAARGLESLIETEGLGGYPVGAEDLLVGEVLRRAGVPFSIEPRFIPYGNDDLRPKPGNDIITAHACDPPWKAHRTEFLGHTPVVSCRPRGRLGNLMFEVAAAIGYAERHPTHEAVFDASQFPAEARETFLRKLKFGAVPAEVMAVNDPPDFTFPESIPYWPTCSVIFQGYHQSEKYFAHCEDLIRETFEIPEAIEQELWDRYGAILERHPVCIHVRRGDYLKRQAYHLVQPASYYLRGLKFLSSRFDVKKVLCFSDDPEWCRQQLQVFDDRLTVISGQDQYRDLALMSLCRHFIISSSTFSWWGAWLAQAPDKVVIRPDRHFGVNFANYSQADIYPESWLPIGSVLEENELHPRGFRTSTAPAGEQEFDPALCAAIAAVLRAERGSVADFGCGDGRYVQRLREAGIDCDGFDGNPHTRDLTHGTCSVLDLSHVVQLPRTYDWILCLNVTANLPRDCLDVFFENLDRHNNRGAILNWGSAADASREPGRRIVEQLFELNGYHRDPLLQQQMCQRMDPNGPCRESLAVFRKKVVSVPHAISPHEIRMLVNKDDPVILELGCNDGTDTKRILDEFPEATVHCFEPDPRPVERFQISDARCTLHRVAIAAQDGTLKFYMSGGTPPNRRMLDWDLSSSIRRPTRHLKAHPWCTFDRTCQVSARSLDSWFNEHTELTQIDFIWADLQGAEGDLIAGGRTTLCNHTRYLYTEFYDTPMYEGQLTRQQILEQLPEFECVGIYEGYNMLLRNKRLVP